jgi:hypothetical protein
LFVGGEGGKGVAFVLFGFVFLVGLFKGQKMVGKNFIFIFSCFPLRAGTVAPMTQNVAEGPTGPRGSSH